jgi:diaminopimelate epimerase
MIPSLSIVKMSGAGNDFIVLDANSARALAQYHRDWIPRLCQRGLSVGADGVLIVEPSTAGRVRVRFHNPDGSEAFCGNGSRCAARLALDRGYAGRSMLLHTMIGEVPAEILERNVRLILPAPRTQAPIRIDLQDESLEGYPVVAGVPHFVVFLEETGSAPLTRWGPIVRRHPCFGPAGTNLDVVALQRDGALSVRTWERGVEGETLSCGSGAVAVAAAHRSRGGPPQIDVVPASGVPLAVTLPGAAASPDAALLEGDARYIFEGRLSPESMQGF